MVIYLSVLTKRSVIMLLLVIILLSLAVRYPLVEHERQQTDSYFIHLLSESIIQNNYAKWTFSGLSYFGYYPFSYPSGVPFLLSETSMTTGLSLESSILLFNMVLGLLFCLVMFMLARIFISEPRYVILAVLLAVLGSRFVDTTYWNASARGLAIVLITLLLAVLLQTRPRSNQKLYVVAVVLMPGCFVSHHMAVLLAPFATAYILTVVQSQYLLPRIRKRKREFVTAFNVFMLVGLVSVSFLYFDFFGNLLLVNLQKTSLFDIEPAFLSVFLNTASAYTNQIGFVLPVAVLGIPIIVKTGTLNLKTIFPLIVLLIFVPLLGNHFYVSMLLAPFVAVIGALVIRALYRGRVRKSLVTVGVMLLISSSIVMPLWSTSRWNSIEYLSGDTVEVQLDLFNDAKYLRYLDGGGCAVSNVESVTLLVAADSGHDFLGSDVMLALNGDIASQDIERNVTWSESSFPVNLYKWFQYDGSPYMGQYVRILMVYGFSTLSDEQGNADVRQYFQSHSSIVVLVDNRWDNEFVDTYSIRTSRFLSELYACEYAIESNPPVPISSYVFYSSGESSMMLVGLFE